MTSATGCFCDKICTRRSMCINSRSRSKVAAHFLAPTSDLGRQFSNCELRRITDVWPESFFARFARSVVPLIDDFASSPGKMISKSGALPEKVEPPRPSNKRKRFVREATMVTSTAHREHLMSHRTGGRCRGRVNTGTSASSKTERTSRSRNIISRLCSRLADQDINFYPRTARAKARWISEHPNVYLTKDVESWWEDGVGEG